MRDTAPLAGYVSVWWPLNRWYLLVFTPIRCKCGLASLWPQKVWRNKNWLMVCNIAYTHKLFKAWTKVLCIYKNLHVFFSQKESKFNCKIIRNKQLVVWGGTNLLFLLEPKQAFEPICFRIRTGPGFPVTSCYCFQSSPLLRVLKVFFYLQSLLDCWTGSCQWSWPPCLFGLATQPELLVVFANTSWRSESERLCVLRQILRRR